MKFVAKVYTQNNNLLKLYSIVCVNYTASHIMNVISYFIALDYEFIQYIFALYTVAVLYIC